MLRTQPKKSSCVSLPICQQKQILFLHTQTHTHTHKNTHTHIAAGASLQRGPPLQESLDQDVTHTATMTDTLLQQGAVSDLIPVIVCVREKLRKPWNGTVSL